MKNHESSECPLLGDTQGSSPGPGVGKGTENVPLVLTVLSGEVSAEAEYNVGGTAAVVMGSMQGRTLSSTDFVRREWILCHLRFL